MTSYVNGGEPVTFNIKILSARLSCFIFSGRYSVSFLVYQNGNTLAPEGYSVTYDSNNGILTVSGDFEWYTNALMIACGNISKQ